MAITDSGDYGFVVSQLGVDAMVAADQQLINNSSWRNMMIQKTATVTLASGNNIVVAHGLTYPPAWMLYAVNAGETHLINTSTLDAKIDSTSLTITNNTGITASFRYYIYRIPLNQTFTAPIYELSTVGAVEKDKDIGIKVLKPGKRMASTDLRDYNYHSGTRSPMVHAVVQGAGTLYTSPLSPDGTTLPTGYYIKYTNNLGYVPIFLGFSGGFNGVTWFSLFGLEQSFPHLYVFSTGDVWIFTHDVQADWGSIIIFKDPYAVGAVTTVTV